MKPPKSKMAELAANASGGEKSHAETAESAEFKMTELGPIPVDWEVKRLGDVSSLITKGTTPTSVGCDFECYGINFIKAESISDNGDFIPEKFAHIDEHTDMLLSRSKLKKGDFLFSIAGVLGRVALVTDEVLPANTNQALAVIRLGSNNIIDKRYLFFALKSEYLRSRVKEENVAAAQANLSLQDVNDFHVALPPLAEQRRIARALSDIDEFILALGKLIEKKRNIKTGAMQELLTGKTRLPGFKGKWVEKRLGECGMLVRDMENPFDSPNKQFIEYSMPAFDAGKNAQVISGKNMLSSRTRIRGEVLLFNKLNVRQRRIWYINACPNNAICSSEFLPYYSDVINLLLLAYILDTEQCTSHFIDVSKGTSNSQKRISPKDFEDYMVLLPPSSAEQKAIAAVLSDMDAEIAALEADRAKYERIKSGMMQELLTGKTRLKGE